MCGPRSRKFCIQALYYFYLSYTYIKPQTTLSFYDHSDFVRKNVEIFSIYLEHYCCRSVKGNRYVDKQLFITSSVGKYCRS